MLASPRPNFFNAPRRVTDWARFLVSSSNLWFMAFHSLEFLVSIRSFIDAMWKGFGPGSGLGRPQKSMQAPTGIYVSAHNDTEVVDSSGQGSGGTRVIDGGIHTPAEQQAMHV
jgi:hypothetical protein